MKDEDYLEQLRSKLSGFSDVEKSEILEEIPTTSMKHKSIQNLEKIIRKSYRLKWAALMTWESD